MSAKRSVARCLVTKNGNLLVFLPEKLIPENLKPTIKGNQFIYLDGKSGKWCKHPQKEVVEKTALGQGEWSFLLGASSQKPRPITEKEMKSLEVALVERALYLVKNKRRFHPRKSVTSPGQRPHQNGARPQRKEFVKTRSEKKVATDSFQKGKQPTEKSSLSHVTTLHIVDEETNEAKEVAYENVAATNSLADFFKKKDARKVA